MGFLDKHVSDTQIKLRNRLWLCVFRDHPVFVGCAITYRYSDVIF